MKYAAMLILFCIYIHSEAKRLVEDETRHKQFSIYQLLVIKIILIASLGPHVSIL